MCKIEAESAAADINSNQILTWCFINDREEYGIARKTAKKREVVWYQHVLFKSKYTLLERDYKLRGYNSINDWLTNKKPLLLCISLRIWVRSTVCLTLSHPTTNWQRATCFYSASAALKLSQRNQLSKKRTQKKEKKRLKASDSNHWLNLLWQLCTHQWQCLSLFLSWSLTLSLSLSLTISLSLLPPCSVSLFSLGLVFYCPPSPCPPDPLPCLLLNRMSLYCTLESCFYGSVSKQASQQDTVVQMSRGRSLTQPSEQSDKLNSFSLQSCGAKTNASHFNFCCGKHCWDQTCSECEKQKRNPAGKYLSIP